MYSALKIPEEALVEFKGFATKILEAHAAKKGVAVRYLGANRSSYYRIHEEEKLSI